MRIRYHCSSVFFGIVSFCLLANCKKNDDNYDITKNPAVGSPPSCAYNLIWEDNFDGSTLDTAKWDYYVPEGVHWREAYYSKRAISLDGKGNLNITTSYSGDSVITGMISSKDHFDYKYGYIECRVKMQSSIGQWSAFWLHPYSFPVGGSAKDYGAEIDIFEYFKWKGDVFQHDIFWNGYGPELQSSGLKERLIPGLQTGYHTFGLEWTPSSYLFTVDGHRSWQTTQGISGVRQFIILSIEVATAGGGNIKDGQFPDNVSFDYIKVYQK